MPESVRAAIRRIFGADLSVVEATQRILDDVRLQGDRAIIRYIRDIDGLLIEDSTFDMEVSRAEIASSYSQVEPTVIDALQLAAGRVRSYHQRQLEHSIRSFRNRNLGQIVRPLSRVGIYVPGTKVVYPSTVLMTAIPARVAGVAEVWMSTPCAPGGEVSPLKLVAADIAGVDRVFRVGGVPAIAAFAYGTESISAVDKICGPGNVFVTAAKKLVYGFVGVDGIFGPSETLVIADESARAHLVAADLLAGAEHDEQATAMLITTSASLATKVQDSLRKNVSALPRREAALTALRGQGVIAVVSALSEALEIANQFAPEHLCLHVANPEACLDLITNAGSVFLGQSSVESIGDYTAGPSHVLPTGGASRFSSPLGVGDFLKITNVISLDAKAASDLGPAAATIARAEGLLGHALAIEDRLEGEGRL